MKKVKSQFFIIVRQQINYVMCTGICYSLNSRLTKMEREYQVNKRWSPTDPQYISSLVAHEAVKAKQTKEMLLVSGRRRWFLLSLKRKYSGIPHFIELWWFISLLWKSVAEALMHNIFRFRGAKTSKKTCEKHNDGKRKSTKIIKAVQFICGNITSAWPGRIECVNLGNREWCQ